MKKVIVIVLFALLYIGTANANLSDSFFCQIRKNEVVISLKKTDGYYTCRDIIASIEQLMLKTIKDIQMVDVYISVGRNISYRYNIKAEKQALFEKLKIFRRSVIDNMKIFEANLVTKSVQYFLLRITPYRVNLQTSLNKIEALTASGYATPSLISYGKLLSTQLSVIEEFDNITSSEKLQVLLARYVYLKNIIIGRSE